MVVIDNCKLKTKSMLKSIKLREMQSGISLVEILIALVLGLLLTIGMVEIFLGSKQAYRSQDALSRIQENGRFSMEVLGRDIRMAGFQGCGSLDIVEPNVIARNPPAGGFSASTAIQGYFYDGSNWDPLLAGAPSGVIANTDLISISRGSDCGAYLVGNMTADNANIQLNPDNTCNFNAGDLILISDCTSSDLFRATNVSEGSSKITIAHAKSVNGNTSNRLSKAYGEDAQIYGFTRVEYYLKQNSFGRPALFRRENGTENELVEDVENMQVLYGEDTTSDFFADQYVQAPSVTSWPRVGSVRLTLTMRSKDENITLDRQRMTQDMTSSIAVRNRLP